MPSHPDAAELAAYPATRMLTTEEAVLVLHQLYGVRTTTKTMRQWRYERRGPVAVVITGRTMYSPSDLKAWVEQQVSKSRQSQQRATTGRL
jgi:hypothetical protein